MNVRKEIPAPFFLGILVVVILIAGYFFWTRNLASEPTLPPGQDLQHPFGAVPAARPGDKFVLPAPGTVGPHGFGPSPGAPIPRFQSRGQAY